MEGFVILISLECLPNAMMELSQISVRSENGFDEQGA